MIILQQPTPENPRDVQDTAENLQTIITSLFSEESRQFWIEFGINIGIFVLFILLSVAIGRYTLFLVRAVVRRFAPSRMKEIRNNLLEPVKGALRLVGTLILISLSLNVLKAYQPPSYHPFYDFLDFFVGIAIIFGFAWLASRIFSQFLRLYGLEAMRKFGLEIDELLLVGETVANVIIGFVAVVAFAQSQDIDLAGLLAGVGIGGLAIAFAAQKTLEQLLGTAVLYLDRPFIPGEYIRMPNGLFGRIESIGLRSTKIRTAAKSTLYIVPNSTMANLEIENVTRGKKVMVLLYLDFAKKLNEREQALVEQVVSQSTNSLFGIDPGSTRVAILQPEDRLGDRARISFFILGSSENSIQLRKRLLELANENISEKLSKYGIQFTTSDPTVYVESPITI